MVIDQKGNGCTRLNSEGKKRGNLFLSYIYLIRHGRTQWNKEEVFRGQADIPLDELGRRQAAAIGETLKGKGIRAMITSPLKRAVETATIAKCALTDIKIIEDPRLTDVNFGEWQGLTLGEVKTRYPQLYKTWATNPGDVTFPGGDSLKQVAQRCWSVLMEVSLNDHVQPVALFTHRVVNKILLIQALGAGFGAFWKVRQDTACINLLVREGDTFSVHLLNDTCHLRDIGANDRIDF